MQVYSVYHSQIVEQASIQLLGVPSHSKHMWLGWGRFGDTNCTNEMSFHPKFRKHDMKEKKKKKRKIYE